MNYGGGGPGGGGQGGGGQGGGGQGGGGTTIGEVATTNVAAIGQAIGTVDNPSLMPSTSLFSQQAYEEDGDSVLGSLLPNVCA